MRREENEATASTLRMNDFSPTLFSLPFNLKFHEALTINFCRVITNWLQTRSHKRSVTEWWLNVREQRESGRRRAWKAQWKATFHGRFFMMNSASTSLASWNFSFAPNCALPIHFSSCRTLYLANLLVLLCIIELTQLSFHVRNECWDSLSHLRWDRVAL